MRITEVKVFPVTDDKLKAFVSVVFNHCFMVNDIKVIEGRDGRFISMPSRRKRNGKFKDIAHPLNSDTRHMLEREILEEYDRVLSGEPPSKESPSRELSAREPSGGEASGREASSSPGTPGDGSTTTPEPPMPRSPHETMSKSEPETEPSSLEEVTEKHLSDSFWTS